MEKLPFQNNRRSDRPLHRIHTDTMGPITPTSFPGENKFIIVFIDDHSIYARVYYVKHKSQSGECLQKYLEHTRNVLGEQEKVCYIRSDNGTEFTFRLRTSLYSRVKRHGKKVHQNHSEENQSVTD